VYCPKLFKEERKPVLHELMRSHPLATWTCWVDGQLAVNHIPFLLDETAGEHGSLLGHVGRANPIWKLLDSATPSVAVFQGAQCYISPNWYPSKQENGKVVPTWNYAVVHAHGQPKAIDDEAWLMDLVSKLSDVHETSQDRPWKVSDAPEKYMSSMARGIVGIEIPIQTLEGRWKVSQNKNEIDKAGVVRGLSESTEPEDIAMSELVQTHTR
jgi:transcriptional regulator